jgi:hypothetical protein
MVKRFWDVFWSLVGSIMFTVLAAWYQGIVKAEQAQRLHLDPVATVFASIPAVQAFTFIAIVGFALTFGLIWLTHKFRVHPGEYADRSNELSSRPPTESSHVTHSLGTIAPPSQPMEAVSAATVDKAAADVVTVVPAAGSRDEFFAFLGEVQNFLDARRMSTPPQIPGIFMVVSPHERETARSCPAEWCMTDSRRGLRS